MTSIFLPWIRFSTGETWSAVQAADPALWVNASLAISMVVAGGLIALLSRYGGLLTMTGVWQFVASPPGRFLFVASNVVITSSFETGVWLAWAGATISLLGSSWTLPFGLPKTEANRKKFGMILFPVGVVVLVLGSTIPVPGSIILILSGLILLGVCIVLLLPFRGRTLVQILTDRLRGDKHGEKRLEEIANNIRHSPAVPMSVCSTIKKEGSELFRQLVLSGGSLPLLIQLGEASGHPIRASEEREDSMIYP